MSMSHRSRKWLAGLWLAALLVLPLHVGAGTAPPSPADEVTLGESFVGVMLAMVCGASIAVARYAPHPAVIATAVGSCTGMLLDAWVTPDSPPGR